MAPSGHNSMIGQTLGHYRIEAQLGAGGMGVVYRAHDTSLERSVAVKVLGERMLGEPNARARFLREARTASALNHPNICTVQEVGEENGQAYIVMEHVEGRPLSDLLASGILPDAVVRYGIQIADALAHAHERGIVHRDLKTNNVIITPAGRAKVLDFGLAKRLATDELQAQTTRATDSLTDAGKIVGTLHYLAPEVLRGEAADTRTDVWALGVLLYELASGERPFPGKSWFEVTAAILGQPPRPLPERVPVGLRSVIERCLAKEPGERYQRGSELHAVLEAVQSGSFTGPVAKAPRAASRRWLLGGVAATAILAAGLLAMRFLASPARSIDSIAVLPFANVGGDPDTESLSDGVTESVISSLSRIPKLKVIAFSSVLRYKGKTVDPRDVLRELPVAAILTGRIQQRGGELSITAELVDTRDLSRLWGEQYDQKLTNILAVQDDISQKISERLRRQLTGEEQGRLRKRYTENAEAYQLYLKGRYHWYKFTPEGYEKSLEYYQEAIARDPAYALAYAGLADTYVSMGYEGLLPPQEALPRIEAATRRALEIDDQLGEAHTSLGSAHNMQWRFPEVEKEWRRAIELNPGYVPARRFLAQTLRTQGRFDGAIAEMRRAQELDPLSVETTKTLGSVFFWAGQTDEAIAQYQKALELDPDAASVRDLLADAYARKSMDAEALAEKQRHFRLSGDEDTAASLGRDYAVMGYRGAMQALARRDLEAMQERAKEAYVSPMAFAYLYAALDEKDHALEWLEKAYEERSPWLSFIKNDPQFEGLRADPRFARLLQRIGFAS
jgi:serine/threonine-protein kinase